MPRKLTTQYVIHSTSCCLKELVFSVGWIEFLTTSDMSNRLGPGVIALHQVRMTATWMDGAGL